jgi:hypothetical protein
MYGTCRTRTGKSSTKGASFRVSHNCMREIAFRSNSGAVGAISPPAFGPEATLLLGIGPKNEYFPKSSPRSGHNRARQTSNCTDGRTHRKGNCDLEGPCVARSLIRCHGKTQSKGSAGISLRCPSPLEIHFSAIGVNRDLRTWMRFCYRNFVVPIQSLRQFCCGKFKVNYSPRFSKVTRGRCVK